MRQELIARARRGDREAFGVLAAGEVDRLHAIARLVLRDPDLAEDAVQEALVRCWRQLPKLRDVERFDGWLYRILMRTAADQSTDAGGCTRRPSRPSTWSRRWPTAPGTSRIGTSSSAASRQLSIDHRAVVVLHHYVGSTPARSRRRTLGIPPGTAKSRYHYAMSALRASLQADARVGDPREVLA